MQGALDSFNGGKAKGMETIKEYSAPYQAAGD